MIPVLLIGVLLGFLGGCGLTMFWITSKPRAVPPKVACWIIESENYIQAVRASEIKEAK